ncbi:hypothetical protein [Halobacteriovorax marinus]|nr:hypothetical protein [Halobacteriovorax marinus]
MFDDLKEKIDGLVSSVKSKLPGSKSDDDDEEYEDEEFDEKTEEIDVSEKLDESDDEYDEDEDEDEEDDEDEAKAKKQKMMRLGLVAIVLVLGASILMDDGAEEDELPAPAPIARKRPKRKKKPVKKNVEKNAEKEAQVAKKEAAPTNESPAEETPVAQVPSENTVNEQPSENVEAESTSPSETSTEEVVVENELKLNDDSNEEQKAAAVEPLGQDGFESNQDAQTPTLGEGSSDSANSNDDMSNALDNLTQADTPEMIEKVVKEKLEYQEPPNYLETGRGLVYNCTGKHWACVDQTSYINCKKNNDWSKENEKNPECFPSNVYSSFTDCRTIQIHNINTITETEFCKK